MFANIRQNRQLGSRPVFFCNLFIPISKLIRIVIKLTQILTFTMNRTILIGSQLTVRNLNRFSFFQVINPVSIFIRHHRLLIRQIRFRIRILLFFQFCHMHVINNQRLIYAQLVCKSLCINRRCKGIFRILNRCCRHRHNILCRFYRSFFLFCHIIHLHQKFYPTHSITKSRKNARISRN